MTWEKRGKRKVKKLSESTRKFVINRDRRHGCWFKYPGICTGWDANIQVHHIIEAEDGGSDDPDNLVAACEACHVHYSAQQSQKRAVEAAWDWKRKPEKHPGVLD